MEALRAVYDDAPEEIRLRVPTEWRHRRIEVVVSEIDRSSEAPADAGTPEYRVHPVARRILPARDSLHER